MPLFNLSGNMASGLIRTDFTRVLWGYPEAGHRLNRGYPMRRLGEPDEIAGAAVFLVSRAAAYVNGHTVVVDGASTA